MGINWWESDPSLSSPSDDEQVSNGKQGELERENQELRERLERLERRLEPADD